MAKTQRWKAKEASKSGSRLLGGIPQETKACVMALGLHTLAKKNVRVCACDGRCAARATREGLSEREPVDTQPRAKEGKRPDAAVRMDPRYKHLLEDTSGMLHNYRIKHAPPTHTHTHTHTHTTPRSRLHVPPPSKFWSTLMKALHENCGSV
jgi:hypothetical protein